MPNWCRNRVTVYGNEEEVSKVVDIFESKDTVFGKIIPSPDWKNIPNEDGELPESVEHKNPKTGEVSFVTTEFPNVKNMTIDGMIGTLLIGIPSGILQVQLRLKKKTQRLLRSTSVQHGVHPKQYAQVEGNVPRPIILMVL